MVLEHMVWLTPKAGVSDDKMEEILASIRALTHIPGVLAISAGQNITDRANGATHGVLVTLEQGRRFAGVSEPPRSSSGRGGIARALRGARAGLRALTRADGTRRFGRKHEQGIARFMVIEPVS